MSPCFAEGNPRALFWEHNKSVSRERSMGGWLTSVEKVLESASVNKNGDVCAAKA